MTFVAWRHHPHRHSRRRRRGARRVTQSGDVIRIEIAGIGELVNRVA